MGSNLRFMTVEEQNQFKQNISSKQKEQEIRDNCVCKSLSLPACGTCDVKIKELMNEKNS